MLRVGAKKNCPECLRKTWYIEISKNVKFILKLQSVFKEIWKLIKERICTSRRAVNAYEIGSDRRMFGKDANCFEAQEFGYMNNFDLESFTH